MNYWNDSVYGRTYGEGSPVGGFYGAGRFSYSVRTVSASISVDYLRTASLKDVNFDTRLNDILGELGIYSANITTLDSTMDYDAIRGCAFVTGIGDNAIQISYLPEYTKIERTNSTISIIFMVRHGNPAFYDNSTLTLWYLPTNKQLFNRGDFQYRGNDIARGNIDWDASANKFAIPEMDMQFQSENITAKTRKLKAVWTPQLAQDLNAYHAIDAQAEITGMLSQQITMEMD